MNIKFTSEEIDLINYLKAKLHFATHQALISQALDIINMLQDWEAKGFKVLIKHKGVEKYSELDFTLDGRKDNKP